MLIDKSTNIQLEAYTDNVRRIIERTSFPDFAQFIHSAEITEADLETAYEIFASEEMPFEQMAIRTVLIERRRKRYE